MNPDEAPKVLLEMIEQKGLQVATLQLPEVWPVFKEFLELPLAQDGEELVEAYAWECAALVPDMVSGRDMVIGTLHRLYSPAPSEKNLFGYSTQREGFGLVFEFELDDELRQFEEDPEQIDEGTAEDFFEAVERAVGFQLLCARKGFFSGGQLPAQ